MHVLHKVALKFKNSEIEGKIYTHIPPLKIKPLLSINFIKMLFQSVMQKDIHNTLFGLNNAPKATSAFVK